jgi:hypothetical protein
MGLIGGDTLLRVYVYALTAGLAVVFVLAYPVTATSRLGRRLQQRPRPQGEPSP